jgi:hypothetical protein
MSELRPGQYTLRTYAHYYAQGIVRTFVHDLLNMRREEVWRNRTSVFCAPDFSPKPAYIGAQAPPSPPRRCRSRWRCPVEAAATRF